MTMSVALLMNTMQFSMDHHHLVLHLLGKSHMTPLASVPSRMTTVTGMVSDVILKDTANLMHGFNLQSYAVNTRVHRMDDLFQLVLYDKL